MWPNPSKPKARWIAANSTHRASECMRVYVPVQARLIGLVWIYFFPSLCCWDVCGQTLWHAVHTHFGGCSAGLSCMLVVRLTLGCSVLAVSDFLCQGLWQEWCWHMSQCLGLNSGPWACHPGAVELALPWGKAVFSSRDWVTSSARRSRVGDCCKGQEGSNVCLVWIRVRWAYPFAKSQWTVYM